MITTLATILVSVWTFSGDNTWTPKEWRGLVKSAFAIIEERTDVKLVVARWYNNRRDSLCGKHFHYAKEEAYGNCLLRKAVKRHGSQAGFNLFLTPPIPAGDGINTYLGGLSTGICSIDTGTAMIHGKRISTHIFNDGGNAGWEMTRLAIVHESLHLLGANHPEDVGKPTPINIMDTNALEYVSNEYQVKVDSVYENFRDVLPLTKFSRVEIKKCLKG